MDFEHYFSEKELLKVLCIKRAVLSKKVHDKLFFKKLLEKKDSNNSENLLYSIFPPRNKWIRLTKKERRGKHAIHINAIQLERTVLRETNKFKKRATESWHIELVKVLKAIRIIVNSGYYKVPRPEIFPQFKELKSGNKVFRPIAFYEIFDRIIITQCNKYLTNSFDASFFDCSYAFRKRTSGKVFSHHKAVEDIIEYKKNQNSEYLWVAECDIKKFYDCIDHQVILNLFEETKKELELTGVQIDERAIDIFKSYLKSYSFNKYVKGEKENQVIKGNGEFGWIDSNELVHLNNKYEKNYLGIPQGGAISCLISNLVMHYVDKKVLDNNVDGNLFYARFCDDMVLLHPEKEICEQALDAYKEGLKEIKLLAHEPKNMDVYTKAFWDSKSKRPYKWGKPINDRALNTHVPWLSFVGYQISWDLKLRVRKSSLKKEIEKQIAETGKVISLIKRNEKFRVSENSIKYSLQRRLLAMSVGRKSIFNIDQQGTMCWTAGFRLLRRNDFINYQIKNLDRKRCAQFKRLDNSLKSMNDANRPDKTDNDKEKLKEPSYYGAPFSYYEQFKSNR